MAKTRRKPDHKARVAKRNQTQKTKVKSMEAPQFKPFRQVPHVEPDQLLEISGQEYQILQEFLGVFAEPITVMQNIFRRNLNNGKVTIKYIDNEGAEVSKEEVQAYMTEMTNYLQTQAKAEGGVAVEVPVEAEVEAEADEPLVAVATAEETSEPNPSKRKLKVAN